MQTRTDSDTVGPGPLENYPIGIPTRFDFTRTKVNGWGRTAVNYGLFVVRKSESEARVFSKEFALRNAPLFGSSIGGQA